MTELLVLCVACKVPFPAFETMDDKLRLPRRFFLFFDLLFRAGRHNREWWKDATSREPGEKTKRFGSTMIEAHVKTTIRENYFRWMYQILSDPRLIPEPDMATEFMTEYECEKEDFPEELACSLPRLARLPKTCEIRYRNAATTEEQEEKEGEETTIRTMGEFEILTEAKEAAEFKLQQQQQRKLIINLAGKHGKEHKHRLDLMRSQIKLVRDNYHNLDSEGMKRVHADTKRKLKLYGNDEEGKQKKRRKSGNNSKCADRKIKIFDDNKKQLDIQETYRYREAWEVMYKKVMNNHAGEDETDEDRAGDIKCSDWIDDKQLDVESWDEV
jgi:hypothetical protein